MSVTFEQDRMNGFTVYYETDDGRSTWINLGEFDAKGSVVECLGSILNRISERVREERESGGYPKPSKNLLDEVQAAKRGLPARMNDDPHEFNEQIVWLAGASIRDKRLPTALELSTISGIELTDYELFYFVFMDEKNEDKPLLIGAHDFLQTEHPTVWLLPAAEGAPNVVERSTSGIMVETPPHGRAVKVSYLNPTQFRLISSPSGWGLNRVVGVKNAWQRLTKQREG